MDALSSLLQDVLDWAQYEATAYNVLVQDGPLEASEVALKADIPDARVYGVLSGLENQGCVKKQGKRPALYDAQHPRKVIQQKQEEFQDKSEEAKSKLEQAYEVERDDPYSSSEQAWVLTSEIGTVNELRNQIDDATEEVLFVDSNLQWLTTKDTRTFQQFVENGGRVKAVGSPSYLTNLEALATADIDTKQHDEIERSYYVIDGKTVILRVSRGNTGIIYTDKAQASLYMTSFNTIYQEAEEVTGLAP